MTPFPWLIVLDLKVNNAHLNGKMRIRIIYFYAGLPIRMPFSLGENAHQDAIYFYAGLGVRMPYILRGIALPYAIYFTRDWASACRRINLFF